MTRYFDRISIRPEQPAGKADSTHVELCAHLDLPDLERVVVLWRDEVGRVFEGAAFRPVDPEAWAIATRSIDSRMMVPRPRPVTRFPASNGRPVLARAA